jgi:uncharacterized membrane protein
VTHWSETVFLLGFVYLFFAFSPIIGIIAVILVYLLELVIDNASARVKWQFVMKSSWAIAAIVSVVNLAALYYLRMV